MKTLLAIFFIAASVSAQAIPDAPSHVRRTQLQRKPVNVYLEPFRDPFFYAGTLTLTSGVLADVHSVQNCERDKTCFEANPGADKYSHRIPEIALVALGDYGCSLMLHGHRWYRAFCMAAPVALGLYHWHDVNRITYLKDERLVR